MGDADKALPAKEPERARLLRAASRHALSARVARGLRVAGVLASDPLLLMVSGGGDSMAMLVALAAIRERTDATLGSIAVLSIDHGLRDESSAECAAAIELCRSLGIAQASVATVSVARGGNLLHEARAARYEAAFAHARRLAVPTVVCAHQADDAAEGLLLALERGGGIDAVESLVPSRAVGGDGLRVVRPLLRITRAELRGYLSDVGVGWHDDPSNALHARGALRSEPALRALVERLAAGAGRLAEEAGALAAWRDAELDKFVPEGATELPRSVLELAPPPFVALAIRRLVHAAGGDIARTALDEAASGIAQGDRSPREFACTGGCELRIDARTVRATAAPR
ncbi:MAG: tRNA lysidine(34) synthetase TilS [Planctomycetota bacterium]